MAFIKKERNVREKKVGTDLFTKVFEIQQNHIFSIEILHS